MAILIKRVRGIYSQSNFLKCKEIIECVPSVIDGKIKFQYNFTLTASKKLKLKLAFCLFIFIYILREIKRSRARFQYIVIPKLL